MESLYKDYGDMTIVNHNVMLVEHSKSGKITNQQNFAIAIASFNDGSDEVWQYGDAKFSKTFIKYTEELYRLRQPIFYPQSVLEKYTDFIFSIPEENKDKLRGSAAPLYLPDNPIKISFLNHSDTSARCNFRARLGQDHQS